MRNLFLLFLLILTIAVWADGFTTYGVHAFNSIRETDQVAVIRLEPKRVTLDMFIAIDGIPQGETVTYILPFWHKPEGFTLEAMKGEDFRKQHIETYKGQFQSAIRQANRTAVDELPFHYLTGACYAYIPLMPIGVLSVLFPTLGKSGYTFSPYASTSVAAGSASLYKVSDDRDMQALVAQSGLPARYATVLKRYHTHYYAIMKLHGLEKLPAKKYGTSQGIHYHFTHQVSGSTYSYTYPLGTGGAWAKPIDFTEIYATCPFDSYLTPTAPTIGATVSWMEMRNWVYEWMAYRKEQGRASNVSATSTVTPLIRYPNAWHRAYFHCNPTEDITVRVEHLPFNLPYLIAITIRELTPAIFVVLGFIISQLISVQITLRRSWLACGQPDRLWVHGRRFLANVAIPSLIGALSIASLLNASNNLSDNFHIEKLWLCFGLLLIFPIGIWYYLLPRADGDLPNNTMKHAYCMSIVWYLLQLPVWLLVAWLCDLAVAG